jgi:hypothetical protein
MTAYELFTNLLVEVYGLSYPIVVAATSYTESKGDLMSIQEVSPEQLAELFHHYHEALASDFGCEGSPNSAAWDCVPQPEKKRLVAAARLALLELSAADIERKNSRRYFATPGEAEWGC